MTGCVVIQIIVDQCQQKLYRCLATMTLFFKCFLYDAHCHIILSSKNCSTESCWNAQEVGVYNAV